jgi:hypothetical protein
MMSVMTMVVMGMTGYRTRSDVDFLPVVSLLWSRKGEAHCDLFVFVECDVRWLNQLFDMKSD